MVKAEQVTAPLAYHGEGPIWHDGLLHWVDMLAGDVLTLSTSGEVGRRHVSDVVAALRPRTGGGYVYAVQRGFALDRGPRTPVENLPELWSNPGVRMNEGSCDPRGRFYCGSMAYDLTPGAACLYRLNVDGSVVRVLGDVTISNGLDWDPTGSRAYYIDTGNRRIDLLDDDPDVGLTCRRPFVTIDEGSPDGLTVDAEGGVWVALWGGGAVHRYTPEGMLSEVVQAPASQVSACTFGGSGLEELYITTSRQDLAADAEPGAGAVFRAVIGVAGVPVRPFDG